MKPICTRLPLPLGLLAALASCAGLAAPFALLLSSNAGAHQGGALHAQRRALQAAYIPTVPHPATVSAAYKASSSASHSASVSHLQVSEVEYRLQLSRGTVKAGPLDLEQIDAGMDSHDLRLRRDGSSATIYGRLLNPGKRWDGVVYLKPGLYRLWCSLPEHEKLGMHATLRVVR